MGFEQGLAPRDRKLQRKPRKGKQLTANQWRNTPKQNKFMSLWLDADSETFGNAYQSAIKAGYSEHYARNITSRSTAWIEEYVRKTEFNETHIIQQIQKLITETPNSKSPDDTKVKALELLSKIKGMLIQKHELESKSVNINIDLTGQDTERRD